MWLTNTVPQQITEETARQSIGTNSSVWQSEAGLLGGLGVMTLAAVILILVVASSVWFIRVEQQRRLQVMRLDVERRASQNR